MWNTSERLQDHLKLTDPKTRELILDVYQHYIHGESVSAIDANPSSKTEHQRHTFEQYLYYLIRYCLSDATLDELAQRLNRNRSEKLDELDGLKLQKRFQFILLCLLKRFNELTGESNKFFPSLEKESSSGEVIGEVEIDPKKLYLDMFEKTPLASPSRNGRHSSGSKPSMEVRRLSKTEQKMAKWRSLDELFETQIDHNKLQAAFGDPLEMHAYMRHTSVQKQPKLFEIKTLIQETPKLAHLNRQRLFFTTTVRVLQQRGIFIGINAVPRNHRGAVVKYYLIPQSYKQEAIKIMLELAEKKKS